MEKDYYLTEVLRIANQKYPEETILKGGTSLTKGWSILSRISEDIDLVLDQGAFGTEPTGKEVNALLLALAVQVSEHPGLHHDPAREKVVGGKARHDYFDYESALSEPTAGISRTVLLEAGVRSANWPTERRHIQSFVGIHATGLGQAAVADDVAGFDMRLLDFRRTFVEKLFALDGLVRGFAAGGTPLGRNARHYADVHVLLERTEIQSLIGSAEFDAFWADQDSVSRRFFPRYEAPPQRFRKSVAVSPPAELRARIEDEYIRDVEPLFLEGGYPRFSEVLDRLQAYDLL